MTRAIDRTEHVLLPGALVEVQNRFERTFAPGFEVTSVTDDGYRIRRSSDGVELPAVFSFEEIRPR